MRAPRYGKSRLKYIIRHILVREGWLTVKGKIQKRGPKALSIIADDLAPLKII